MAESNLKKWKQHLTKGRREHFESVGEELVRAAVAAHSYSNPDKYYGALVWLAEERKRANLKGWLMTVVGIVGVAIALAAYITNL